MNRRAVLLGVALAGVLHAAPPWVQAQVIAFPPEVPLSFDSRGRITVLFPRTARPYTRDAAWWPLKSNDWREARLYALDTTSATAGVPSGERVVAIIAVVGNNGALSRYGLTGDALRRLQVLFDAGAGPGGGPAVPGARSGVELSQPAGYTFVRNQTFLGLVAYGPATSAILSDNGTGAAGGYLLAAGSSFFVAARLIRTRVVTRSQTILGTHGGLRGGAAGAALAAIGDAHGGPGYGAPILLGAVGGTVGGFLAARNMSDGEAAAAGLGADMFALATFGVAGALDALDEESKRKVSLGAAVGTAALGYWVGPSYARRARYNVTAGDASVALTGALIGAVGGLAVADLDQNAQTAAGFATAGLLAGFVLSDRYLVSRWDRSSSDAGWAKLGAAAGALMGGGVAAITESKSQGALVLTAAGATLGLIAADRMIAPAPDAGPMRGVLRTGAVGRVPGGDERVRVSLPSAATAVVLWNRSRSQRDAAGGSSPRKGGAIMNFPAVSVRF